MLWKNTFYALHEGAQRFENAFTIRRHRDWLFPFEASATVCRTLLKVFPKVSVASRRLQETLEASSEQHTPDVIRLAGAFPLFKQETGEQAKYSPIWDSKHERQSLIAQTATLRCRPLLHSIQGSAESLCAE
jgi:hypothetical protein